MTTIQNTSLDSSLTNQEKVLNPIGLSRYNDFCHLLPIKRTTVYKWMKEGKFPMPIINETNFTAWKNSDIINWLNNPKISAEMEDTND